MRLISGENDHCKGIPAFISAADPPSTAKLALRKPLSQCRLYGAGTMTMKQVGAAVVAELHVSQE